MRSPGLRPSVAEDLGLGLLDVGLEFLDEDRVGVDDGVGHGVEHRGGTHGEQRRVALEAAAHGRQRRGLVVADRDHERRPHDELDLAQLHLVGGDVGRRLEHHEVDILVALGLGPLMGLQRVLHEEFVEPELV